MLDDAIQHARRDVAVSKWKADRLPMTRDVPRYPRTNYPVPKKRWDKEIRAFADEALGQSKAGKPLIDVRSPGEYNVPATTIGAVSAN